MTTLLGLRHANTRDTKRKQERSALVGTLIAVIIPIATFGPYITGGVRTEQLAVYGFFVLSISFYINRLNTAGGKRFLVLWVLYICLASLPVLAPTPGSPFPMGSLLAGYDNILLPLALMLLIWTAVPDDHASRLLSVTLTIVAIAMTINGIIALVSTFADLSDVLRPFWAAESVTTTVARNAAEMGRFSGIFNQPAEAGFLYGVGGLAAIYVWRSRMMLLFCSLMVIALGGLVSVSKVFIFGGLPLIIIYWFWSQRGSKRVVAVLSLPVLVIAIVQSGFLLNWSGLNYFGRLFEWKNDEIVTLLSAGRAGEHSSVSQVLDAVISFSPLVGVGAGGWKVAYDSAIVESMVVAGLFGALILSTIVLLACGLYRGLPGNDRFFALVFGILIAGGCLGFSPLTANRVSTVSWLVISLLVIICREARANSASEETDPRNEFLSTVSFRQRPSTSTGFRTASRL